MAVDHGKNVDLSDMAADYRGLLQTDGLRIVKGTNGLRVERRKDNNGAWVPWSNEDCVVRVSATTLQGTPSKSIEIVIQAPGGTFSHRGEVGGITGASWTAEEGP